MMMLAITRWKKRTCSTSSSGVPCRTATAFAAAAQSLEVDRRAG